MKDASSSIHPEVTVGVPVYNHEAFVLECLESIKQSDYPNLHLIVVDDGSSDRSYAIAKEWIKNNERRFLSCHAETKPNEGLVKTANRILSLRKGDYFTLVASDDRLTPDGIRKRVEYLQKHTDKKAVFGDCLVIDNKGNCISQSWLRKHTNANLHALSDDRMIVPELVLRWSVPGPALLARSDLYDTEHGVGKYTEGLKIEDRDLYLRILRNAWLGFIDVSVAAYRLHSTNTFLQADVKAAEDFIKSECGNISHFRGFSRFILRLKCIYYKAKKRRRAREYGYIIPLAIESALHGTLLLMGTLFDIYVTFRQRNAKPDIHS